MDVDDPGKFRGDLIERLIEADLYPRTVRQSLQRLQQPLGMLIQGGVGPALRTGVALIDRILVITDDAQQPVTLHIHFDTAIVRAQTADGALAVSHSPAPSVGAASTLTASHFVLSRAMMSSDPRPALGVIPVRTPLNDMSRSRCATGLLAGR